MQPQITKRSAVGEGQLHFRNLKLCLINIKLKTVLVYTNTGLRIYSHFHVDNVHQNFWEIHMNTWDISLHGHIYQVVFGIVTSIIDKTEWQSSLSFGNVIAF